MALAANGDPIVSDGEHGGVYRVSSKTESVVRLDAGDFVSPQTLGDPTHGVVVGDYFYYIANSGWDVLDEHGQFARRQKSARQLRDARKDHLRPFSANGRKKKPRTHKSSRPHSF